MVRPSPAMTRIAANVATIAMSLAVLLQLLLALGILPVTMAWGGSQDTLTPFLRLAHLAAAAILVGFAYVIRRRAGLVGSASITSLIKVMSWVIPVFLFLNTLGNLASLSLAEKIVFAPITLVAGCASLIVALSKLPERA